METAFGARNLLVLVSALGLGCAPPKQAPAPAAPAEETPAGLNRDGLTVENFHDEYVGHRYEPALWRAVLCELSQLARFAVQTGRNLYLTQYLD